MSSSSSRDPFKFALQEEKLMNLRKKQIMILIRDSIKSPQNINLYQLIIKIE